jgi:hypothetical protein
MLSGPLQKHPLFKTLPNTTKWHLNIQNGVIDSVVIQRAFKEACMAKDSASVSAMLNFDYKPLADLENEHPFYLSKNPLCGASLLLGALAEANYFSHKEIATLLLKHMESWLTGKLTSTESLWSKWVANTVSVVALYQPALAYQQLANGLPERFKLAKAQFEQPEYRDILQALEDLACSPDYFNFAATQLINLSAREVKLGIYHGHYKALHYLTALFHNAGSRTQVSLQARQQFLTTVVDAAAKADNYYQLFVLMKTLGVAADVFDLGEHSYTEDPYYESYINGAIALMMRFAGTHDEHGLCCTAEEELHRILDTTVDSPEISGANDAPYVIFRLFLESKREWDINPLYSLNKLSDFIDDLKKDDDKDEKMILQLERRLEQLASLVADRAFLTEDFRLFLSSKSQRKMCQVGNEVDATSNLDLHSRQSLAERLIFTGKTNIHDIARGWPKCTYVVANFGLVVTDRPHQSDGHHRRIFKSIPIKLPNASVAGRERHYGGHAEEALYDYLLKDENIAYYVAEFKKQFGINSRNHKVYAVIFDLHGTYDMCLSCSEKGEAFQNAFREKFLAQLPNQALKSLRKYPGQLPIIIRYSSDLKYDYPASDDHKKKGVLSVVAKEGAKRVLPSATEHFDFHRDIKQFGANLLLHGKANWHTLWSKAKQSAHEDKPLRLESWSAFSSDSQYNSLGDDARRENYTHLGEVDTTKEVAVSFKKLSLK